jgi:hypothetical protein
MEKTEKTDIEIRDDIVQLLRQQGGVQAHHTALELANEIVRMFSGRRATAAGGPGATIPIHAPVPEPERAAPVADATK